MPTRKAPRIFISYARVDETWVRALHRNLHCCLEHLGYTAGEDFLDLIAIVPGMSWPQRLDRALAEADKLLLVVTPEALASGWVNEELDAWLGKGSGWGGRSLIPVLLRWTPLRTFLGNHQYVDFLGHDLQGHDEARYRKALGELLAGLLDGEDLASPPELPDALEIPEWPRDPLGTDLRRKAVEWLTGYLVYEPLRRNVEEPFGIEGELLEELEPEWAASVAVVRATRGEGPPHPHLRRSLASLGRGLDQIDSELATRLEELLAELDEATPPPPGEETPLRRWLELVREDSEEMDPFLTLRTGTTLLEHVYVDRTVAERQPEAPEEREPTRPRGDPDHLPHTGTTLEALLEEDQRRWVLVGEPGSGKTTLLRHLAHECATRGDLPWIPILVRIADVIGSGRTLPEWLEHHYRERSAPENLGGFLDGEARRAGSRVVVLLDGLDEVAEERRPDARRWLKSLVGEGEWGGARFVVTSRPIPYEPLGDGFEELAIQPLDRPARIELVARYLTEREKPTEAERTAAAGHVTRLERDPWLWEWAGNPLYLTLLALLLREDRWPSPLRHELYRQVIDLLLAAEHRPGVEAMSPVETSRRILAVLAYGMTAGEESELPRGTLERRLLAPQLRSLTGELKEARKRYRDNLPRFLDDLQATGLMGPYAKPNWSFLHRSFREALAGERLAELTRTEEGREAVLERARGLGKARDLEPGEASDLARWAEPYALLVGQVDDGDGLLLSLLDANRPLGLRALGAAQALAPETVRRVLERTGGRRERTEVFRAVPRVVGSAGEALELLDELRRETRDGNDLFWLEWAARQLPRREPDLGPAVEKLLGRFYGHIPAPPRELFTHVEIPEKGRVALWWEIPAGTFLMGSPEDEPGRDDDEGPRHRVRFLSGLRMAAVPVTWAQYAAFDPGHKSYSFPGIPADELAHHPIDYVTWYAAVAFCRWLGQAVPELAGARLPTEAEWEHACRAGSETAYWSGDGEEALEKVGWYDGNSDDRTHRVGELPANPWGLHDVHGNVWEWTLSRWTDDYKERADGVEEDPRAVSVEAAIGDDPGGGGRVLRGGALAFDARRARSAFRVWGLPGSGDGFRGFRVALPAAPSSRG